MTEVVRYAADKKEEWNEFLRLSKNGVFLFDRDYMEYHSDRFADFSLMFYEGKDLVAILPANIEGDVVVSHGGLTFGGLVSGPRMRVPRMLILFGDMMDFLKASSVSRMVYKRIPYIYHSVPSEEDSYALFRNGAKLVRRDVSSTVDLRDRVEFQELRRRCVKKAQAARLEVRKVDDFRSYWGVLEANLAEKHNTRPVHSVAEIDYLHGKFPDSIKLFASYSGDTMLAGVVVYESLNVAHAQYIAGSHEGRQVGALDAVFAYLLNEYYQDKRYFDFGISTENDGLYLNESLTDFKEGFGGRAVCYDFYELTVRSPAQS